MSTAIVPTIQTQHKQQEDPISTAAREAMARHLLATAKITRFAPMNYSIAREVVDVADGIPQCSCRDYAGKISGGCAHIRAARMYEHARAFVAEKFEEISISGTIHAIRTLLRATLTGEAPAEMEQYYRILHRVALELAKEQFPAVKWPDFQIDPDEPK